MLYLAKMAATTIGWVALAFLLFLSTFGASGGIWLLLYILSFLAGVVALLWHHGHIQSQQWLEWCHNLKMEPPAIGIPKLVKAVKQGRPKFRYDKRMTGACTIDEVLQEILDYTYSDYIHTWYRKISDDEQFKYDMRLTLQRVIIAISERSKEVDLSPYLTTRLVDDFASHIRLYRRALNRVREHRLDDTKPPPDLEDIFFDMETEMENNMCRDSICLDEDTERAYLQDVCDVLLFLVLPPEDFHNKPFRYIVREVLVNAIFLPTINLFSDPDYVNQTISWLCKDGTFTHESFLTVLKTTDNTDELQAVAEKVDLDISIQRSKDTGGDDDTVIKQQLGSLFYVKSLCESRIKRLVQGLDEPDIALPGGIDVAKLMVPGQKLYSLPFDVVLNNNVALSFFIEFMSNIGCQNYLFFYLTVEGYRVSAEQQISAIFENPGEKPDLEMLRDAAISIYTQYLGEKASPRLQVEEHLLHKLLDQIQNSLPSEAAFDEVQARILDLLQYDPRFFPAFRKSQLYIKLLAELDLLKETRAEEGLALDEDGMSMSSRSSSLQDSSEDLAAACDSMMTETPLSQPPPAMGSGNFTLSANITNTGVCREHGKSYAIYMITVNRNNLDGTEDVWYVYRRYSDFHDLHSTIQERYDSLSGFALPSKKAFNNMNKDFLEKRRIGLNAYLQTLLNPGVLTSHKGLLELVYQFLEHVVWEKEKTQLSRKVDTVVNPLKNSVKNIMNMGSFVRAMPDNFADGVAKVSGGIRNIPNNMLDGMGRILNAKGAQPQPQPGATATATAPPPIITREMLERAKVGASLDTEIDEDDIPLRILLLLMDEVFDLKTRNQWLRRRIVAILRQIVKTMFGDSINRRILDQVEFMTSADQIAEYLKTFRDAFWPGGELAEPRTVRDNNTKMRTRIVCKSKMLATISEEVAHLLGSETTRQGVMRVFTMFQHHHLNKRLVYVILEGLLETLFPDNKFPEVFRKMHSRSERVKKKSEAPASKPRKRKK